MAQRWALSSARCAQSFTFKCRWIHKSRRRILDGSELGGLVFMFIPLQQVELFYLFIYLIILLRKKTNVFWTYHCDLFLQVQY